MESNLLGAERSAHALDQPPHGEGDQHRPKPNGHRHDDEQTDVEPFGSDGGPIRRTGAGVIQSGGTLLLLAGIGITELVWVALLAYGTYWICQRLPLW